MTPSELISALLDLPSELMHKDIWIDGDGYLEAVKDRKHGVVLSVFKDSTTKESAPSRSHE